MFAKKHWIAMMLCQNNYRLEVIDNACHANLYSNIEAYCFLIPFSDDPLNITKIKYDPNYLQLISDDNDSLIFKPLKTGSTIIIVYTKDHGYTLSNNIIIE